MVLLSGLGFFFIKKRDLSVDFIEIGVDLHLVDNKAFLGCANIYASLLLAKKLHYI
jgi:hypothetical protein